MAKLIQGHQYLLHTVNILNDTIKEPTYMFVSPILSPLHKNIN